MPAWAFRFWDKTLCLWVSGSGMWPCVSEWVFMGYDVSLCEWFWDMTLCLGVSGCGIWRCVSGWLIIFWVRDLTAPMHLGLLTGPLCVSEWVVVGYDAVCLVERLCDVTLCLWVSGCWIWRCVSGWVVSNVSSERNAFFSNLKWSRKKAGNPWRSWPHISEDRSPQKRYCEANLVYLHWYVGNNDLFLLRTFGL